MSNNIIILNPEKPVDNEFSEQFRSASIDELIETFNGDVGKAGWVSARGRFHAALAYEFRKRGFRTLEDGVLSLGHKLRLSDDEQSLVRVENSQDSC